MSLPSVGRGVPPRREAVRRGPAPTPSLPPSASPSPSFPPISGRGSASLSAPGSRSPASPQQGAGNLVKDSDQYHDESGKNPCTAGNTARFSRNYQEDEYALSVDGECHNKLFEGREKVQSRRSNLNRFSLNQIASINRTLKSVSQNTPIASGSQNTPIASGSQNTPIASGSQNTQIASLKTCIENSLILTDGNTPISDTKTVSPYPDGADSSVSWTREKSSTPTLTDLENSIHVDCRLDRLLRVAVDYALPEELGH